MTGFRADAVAQARAAALKALQLDDTLAEAHAALAGVLTMGEWNWTGAERAFRRAIELNPGHASTRQAYSLFLTQLGRLDEALAEGTQSGGTRSPGSHPGSPSRPPVLLCETLRRGPGADANRDGTGSELLRASFAGRWHVFSAKGMHREAIAAYEKFSASPQSHRVVTRWR